tara:strand:- start:145 stop:579 length:435 start_codon:yes stop_codon:yes gene_type:complete
MGRDSGYFLNFNKFTKFKAEETKKYKVYFLAYRKKIVYIGCTNNIRKRLEYHCNYYDPFMNARKKCFVGKKIFSSFRYIIVGDKKKAISLETRLIKKYIPKYNNYRKYYWKPTNKTITAQRPINDRLYYGIPTKKRTICEWTKR